MRKSIIPVLFVLAFPFALPAQSGWEAVAVTGLSAEKEGDSVTVTFRLDIGKGAAKTNRTLIYEPVITNHSQSWALPPVIIRGWRARIAESRHDWAAGQAVETGNPIYAANGTSLVYSASAPWQFWMHGADFTMVATDMGCCSHTQSTPMLLAENLVLPPPVEVIEKIVPQVVERPKTTGDLMAETHPYVGHISDYDRFLPGKLYDDDREGSLTVYYRQASAILEPAFNDNRQTLADIIGSIRRLQNAGDSYVSHVVIAGFASPEGTFNYNDRLAWNRALALKDYIISETGLADGIFETYNGAEDWRGLRLMVEASDLPDKEQIIRIIENVPIRGRAQGTGREAELMKLNNGETYRHLYRHFFPKLRNAAYIRVYYENK